jgi:hypothetical protein
MMKREKKKIHTRHIILGTVLIISTSAAILLFSFLIEGLIEPMMCGDEFKSVSGISPRSAYANCDFFVLNFGNDVSCAVFWTENEGNNSWLSHVGFKLGSLTTHDVERERYWKCETAGCSLDHLKRSLDFWKC